MENAMAHWFTERVPDMCWKAGVAMGLLLGGAGCATLVKEFGEYGASATTMVQVTSSPPGAVGKFTDGRTVVTPAIIPLRSEKDVDAVFSLEGYEPVQVAFRSGFNAWVLGDILAGGLLGLIVDLEQGATVTISPSDLHLDLKPAAAVAPGDKPPGSDAPLAH
jgi:hypothetical protein